MLKSVLTDHAFKETHDVKKFIEQVDE